MLSVRFDDDILIKRYKKIKLHIITNSTHVQELFAAWKYQFKFLALKKWQKNN